MSQGVIGSQQEFGEFLQLKNSQNSQIAEKLSK